MELIFGFLPLPVAIVALAAVGIGGYFVKKYSKNSAIVATTTLIMDSVVTRERVDQTVEAVLAKLKVNPELADRIGDLIADVVADVLSMRAKVVSKSTRLVSAVSDDVVNPAVVNKLVSGPTLLNNLIVEVADKDIAQSVEARSAVTSGVVKAYAAKTVF